MAKISKVLKHAYKNHYSPEGDDFGYDLTRYMCNAVQRSHLFDIGEKRAACKAIHDAMLQHAIEYGGDGAWFFVKAMAQNVTLGALLRACDQSDEPEHLRAWHLALIDKLESEGK